MIESGELGGERRLGSGIVLAVAGCAVGLVAIFLTARRGVTEWPFALVFGLLIAVGEMVQFRVDGVRNRAPIATSAALGYVMLRGPALETPPEVAQIVAVTGLATLTGLFPRAVAGLPWDLVISSRRVLSVACAAITFVLVTPDNFAWNGSWGHAMALTGAMLLSVLSAGLVDALVGAGQDTERLNRPFPAALRDELVVLTRIGLAGSCPAGAGRHTDRSTRPGRRGRGGRAADDPRARPARGAGRGDRAGVPGQSCRGRQHGRAL
jgi:hypothetical protein